MKAYRAILSARMRMLLQYRAAAVAGFVTQLFWGLIRVMIFTAFYETSKARQPMRIDETISYIWLGQAFFALLPLGPDADVRDMVRNGTVAYELVRPVDLYGFWYFRMLATRLAPTALRSAPLLVLAVLFFGLRLPPSASAGVGWGAATVGALAVSCAFATLLTVSLVYTVAGDGIARFSTAFMLVLSGMMIPVPLMPGWAQVVMNGLPFHDIVDAPLRIYLGHIPASGIGAVLANQIAWTALLVLLGRAMLARSARRLVVQGG